MVKNPASSTVAGAIVRIVLETFASEEIRSNEEIVLDFSGPSEDASFGLPTTVSKSRVTIRTTEEDGGKVQSVTFSPSDVLVQADRVILTIPEERNIRKGNFTISFSQLAASGTPLPPATQKLQFRASCPTLMRTGLRR